MGASHSRSFLHQLRLLECRPHGLPVQLLEPQFPELPVQLLVTHQLSSSLSCRTGQRCFWQGGIPATASSTDQSRQRSAIEGEGKIPFSSLRPLCDDMSKICLRRHIPKTPCAATLVIHFFHSQRLSARCLYQTSP